MNSSSDTVVLEDDDDDVEFVDVTYNGKSDPTNAGNIGSIKKKVTNVPKALAGKPFSMSRLPSFLNGHQRPSHNYNQLITQALAGSPERRGTANQICAIIAKKHPYYEYLSLEFNWKGSVYSALRTRKKFFSIVGTNDQNEYLWSFNPTFEEYMLDKWMPKYIKKASKTMSLSSSIQNVPWQPKDPNQMTVEKCIDQQVGGVTSSAAVGSGSLDPVIVFSGTLITSSSVQPCGRTIISPSITNEQPESNSLDAEALILDSNATKKDNQNIGININPWEPEVTVSEDPAKPQLSERETLKTPWRPPEKILKPRLEDPTKPQLSELETLETPWRPLLPILKPLLVEEKSALAAEKETAVVTYPPATSKPVGTDFSLDNLHFRHVILKEEITYRVKFNEAHQDVKKFRLHCTVCDDHIGTSGTVCRKKARLHASLGVLVCRRCYDLTRRNDQFSCQWCARQGRLVKLIVCSTCPFKFCQDCLERNFGAAWYTNIIKAGGWRCFLCETKQIWPHRAIAYFLFRHYRDLRRKKDAAARSNTVSPRQIRFFIQDLSTCCKSTTNENGHINTPILLKSLTVLDPPSTSCKSIATGDGFVNSTNSAINSTVPALPSTLSRLTANGNSTDMPVISTAPVLPTTFVPPVANPSIMSPSTTPGQPMLVIGEQSPGFIYLQTPSSVPSVTLNTGTQYIHNVFPDKRYVVVEPSGEGRPVPSGDISPLSNTIIYTQSPTTLQNVPPLIIPHQSVEMNASIVPDMRPPQPAYSSANNPPPYSISTDPPPYSASFDPPPYSAISVEVTPVRDSLKETVRPACNTSVGSNSGLGVTKEVDHYSASVRVLTSSDLATSEHEIPTVIPCNDQVKEINIQEKNTTISILSARERIERRPMPKSRKQSLLRTVLMNESIESMKRHLQLESSDNSSNETNTNEVIFSSLTSSNDSERDQNMEEPILKSIIQTATERLLSLHKNLNSSSNTNNGNKEVDTDKSVNSKNVTGVIERENLSNEGKSNLKDPVDIVPKIKIKTLKELQDPLIFNDKNYNEVRCDEKNVEDVSNKVPDVIVLQDTEEKLKSDAAAIQRTNETKKVESEVNITDLKQGIIEASRSLINTQKKFKELAQIISCNLIYKPDQAIELVKNFHLILKMCRKQLDQIDSNVKQQYGSLIPGTNFDSVLKSVKKSSEDSYVNREKITKKKKEITMVCDSRNSQSNDASDADIDNIESNQTDSVADSNLGISVSITNNCDNPHIIRPVKRKRDLLDFNPFGKKVILGSPEITEEDLRQIPNRWDSQIQSDNKPNNPSTLGNGTYMEELRRQQLLRKEAWKRKNIWLSTKRKRRKKKQNPQLSLIYNTSGPLMYSDDGTLIKKKRRYKKRRKIGDDDGDDANDEDYHPNNQSNYLMRCRKRWSGQPCRPLRTSAREHASSKAHMVQWMSSSEDHTNIVKPCSVVLQRLDPMIVQIMLDRMQIVLK